MPVSSFGNIVNKAKTANSGGVEPGEYDFVVREAPEVDDSKQKINVRCRIEEGPSQNAIVFKNLMFDENMHEFALKQSVDFVLGIGISEDEFVNMGSLQELADAIHGARFHAKVVKQKPKNWKEGDRMFDNFENISPAGASGPGPQQPPAPQQQYQQAPPPQPQYQQQAPPPQAPPQQQYQQQAPPPPQQAPAPQPGQQDVWAASTPQPDQGQYQQPYQPPAQHGAPPAPPLL